jgi:hypothetical protein
VSQIIQKHLIGLDFDKINFDDKESVKSIIITLLNVVEQLLLENRQLRVEVQQLRDENARLKNPETLWQDAVFRWFGSIVIQNIGLQTDNVEYRREHYYSSSPNKNYYAEIPKDIQSIQFGSDLKALVAVLYS